MFKFKVQAAFITFDFHWASASALIISLVTWEHFLDENCFILLSEDIDVLKEFQYSIWSANSPGTLPKSFQAESFQLPQPSAWPPALPSWWEGGSAPGKHLISTRYSVKRCNLGRQVKLVHIMMDFSEDVLKAQALQGLQLAHLARYWGDIKVL